MLIPARLLTETITVETYQGVVSGTPTFGPATTVRAQVQAVANQPARSANRVAANGGQVPALSNTTLQVWIRPGPTIPVGSRITCRGVFTTVTQVDDNSAPRLPVPAHLALRCERSEFIPSTTVTILRGTPTTDSYGDLVDAQTAVASGLPAAIVEQGQTSNEPVSQRGGIVESYSVRLRAGVDVREGDRIRDDATGRVYRVLDVARPSPATGPQLGTDDITATCRRVSATS